MKQDVLDILDANRVLTLAVNRSDGWPQATMVGYANDDLLIYILISRSSQKFANLRQDNRVAATIGGDAHKLAEIRGLAFSALAYPANTPDQQRRGYERLLGRRPELASLPEPKWDQAAIIRMIPQDIAIVDFVKGLGHSDIVRVGAGLATTMEPVRPDDWGPVPRHH